MQNFVAFSEYMKFNLILVQKYLIDNITNASFFGMVINIKPADSNDLLEEGDHKRDITEDVSRVF